jgi:hypothetical protein
MAAQLDADEGHVAVHPDGTDYLIVPLETGGDCGWTFQRTCSKRPLRTIETVPR